ncbi:MAG: NADH-quinone oxidoreductase subunit J [Prevotella sp.]
MANMIMFIILAVVILGSAVVCVTTKRIMRAATFLLFVLFGVSGLYFLLDYTFLGAAQISVYAGGVTMIYVFAIQLVSKNTLQGLFERFKGSRIVSGALISIVGLITVLAVWFKNQFLCAASQLPDAEVPMSEIGRTLMGAGKYQYILPFEFVSVFLLACIIGGIVISRKDK